MRTRLAHVACALDLATAEIVRNNWQTSMEVWAALRERGSQASPATVLGALRHMRACGVVDSSARGWRRHPPAEQHALPFEDRP